MTTTETNTDTSPRPERDEADERAAAINNAVAEFDDLDPSLRRSFVLAFGEGWDARDEEVKRLTEQNERLRILSELETVKSLREENRRLQTANFWINEQTDGAIKLKRENAMLQDQVAKLRDEGAALREALEKIHRGSIEGNWAWNVARVALKQVTSPAENVTSDEEK